MKTLILLVSVITTLYSQVEIENLGLENKSITSLRINYGIAAVGTEGKGVFWKAYDYSDSVTWNHIPLDGKNIRTVYPHKSGPIGWAIGTGIRPENGDTNFVYCSFLGGDFNPISTGIDPEFTYEISSLDGFPDQTICGETFAAGGRKLYRRYFGDTTWHSVYDLTIEGNVYAVKASQTYPTVIAGGGEGFANHFLVKSYDNGDTWQDISPNRFIQSLDFSDDSAKTIYVSDQFRVYRSTDSGLSWDEIFDTNNEFKINKVLYSQFHDYVFAAGTDEWQTGEAYLYVSGGGSNNWERVNLDINNPIIDIDEDFDGWIYIATPDSGVYRIRDFLVDVKSNKIEIPESFKLYQNYPNPFNPLTVIRYQLPATVDALSNAEVPQTFNSEQNVSLKIYDILAREVATLVNENKKPGNYEVYFDGSNLSSGIYYYRLSTDTFTQTRKMILLK